MPRVTAQADLAGCGPWRRWSDGASLSALGGAHGARV